MDKKVMETLVKIADKHYDGHLTIMKFTTNWRVGFFTPNDREDVDNCFVGDTFVDAGVEAVLAHEQQANCKHVFGVRDRFRLKKCIYCGLEKVDSNV